MLFVEVSMKHCLVWFKIPQKLDKYTSVEGSFRALQDVLYRSKMVRKILAVRAEAPGPAGRTYSSHPDPMASRRVPSPDPLKEGRRQEGRRKEEGWSVVPKLRAHGCTPMGNTSNYQTEPTKKNIHHEIVADRQ